MCVHPQMKGKVLIINQMFLLKLLINDSWCSAGLVGSIREYVRSYRICSVVLRWWGSWWGSASSCWSPLRSSCWPHPASCAASASHARGRKRKRGRRTSASQIPPHHRPRLEPLHQPQAATGPRTAPDRGHRGKKWLDKLEACQWSVISKQIDLIIILNILRLIDRDTHTSGNTRTCVLNMEEE